MFGPLGRGERLPGRCLARLFSILCVTYAAAVAGWQALRLLAGDRWWWLASANVLSFYLFLPLAVLLPLAWFTRQRAAAVALALPAVIFLLLFGGLFLPRVPASSAGDGLQLRVMSLNVLYTNDDGAAIEQLVRAEAPDLICLQEVNPRLAADLQQRLAATHPYASLLAEEDATGLALFSRFPFQDLGEIPDPAWRHGAQAVLLELAPPVLVLNVHALSSDPPLGSARARERFEASFRLREAESRLWLERLAAHDGPALLAGDLNSTEQSLAYALLAGRLADAHRRAGWGLGHTFPATAGRWRWIPFPPLLWRLDYVLYSEHWRPVEARTGPWDGQSDHLPVLATLVLRPDAGP